MINQFRARRILSGVINCLDAERRLLLAGNLASLPEQVSAREDLMNRFQALPPASDPELAPLLEDIRTGAARNRFRKSGSVMLRSITVVKPKNK